MCIDVINKSPIDISPNAYLNLKALFDPLFTIMS